MNKNIKIAIGIGISIIAILSIFYIIYLVGGIQQSVIGSDSISELPSSEKLDFCSIENECYSSLLENGISKEMLVEKGIKIECSSGICYAKKI